MPALDEQEYNRWREEADRALRGARMQAGEGLHNWACFAAEQAAQLAVKGLLHGLGRGPWGHDLVRPAELLTEDADVPTETADRLRRPAVTTSRRGTRTPTPPAPPEVTHGTADAEEALRDAEEVLEYVDGVSETLRGTTG